VKDAVPELVSQRRRWLNGAFFAAVYAQTHFTQIWRTDHSLRRKLALHIEFFYQFVMLAFSFFSLVRTFPFDVADMQTNFYLTFYFVCSSLSDPQVDPFGGWADRIFTVLRYFCILLIMSQFILSMGNRPQGFVPLDEEILFLEHGFSSPSVCAASV
jgi:chitin synthase